MTGESSDRDRAARELHWAAIARYLAGDATPEQRAHVDRWAAAAAANRAELDELRTLWQLTGVLPSPSRIDDLWRGLAARMEQPATPDVHQSPSAPLLRVDVTRRPATGHTATSHTATSHTATRPTVTSRPALRTPGARGWPAALAATAALTVAGAGLWWRATHSEPVLARAVALAARDLATAPGQHLRLQLEDGTTIDLAPASRLHVAASDQGPREVELQGGALFTVTHDSRRPFLVRTRTGLAEDLGTTFAVHAPTTDDTVRVVVLAGLVSLRTSHAPVGAATALHPGQRGTLSGDGAVHVESGVDTAAVAAWARGRVLFREARLRDVAREIGRWYGVTIRIATPAVAERRVTIDMPARALREVLGAITVPLGLRAARTGTTVVLTPLHPP